MTNAVHSRNDTDGGQIVYSGGAAGFVLRQDGMSTTYYSGDHYTIGPDTAAIAAKWLGVRQVVPMHWGTFPLLTGTPRMLKEHLKGTNIEVLELEPGGCAQC
ncbi:MAG: hypothetical protein FJW21_11950 [Acidimicrobiia bacterium]|nr:hypothetical protein [Acidimicrobiia bacterium]